jgi:hypothetical protein
MKAYTYFMSIFIHGALNHIFGLGTEALKVTSLLSYNVLLSFETNF